MRSTIRPRAGAALALAVCAGFQTARAQQAVQTGERIEVTGSRLVSSDAESASPIAIVRAEDIRMDGYGSIELMLNNYPQLLGDQGNRISNGASGTATADLRGLGAQRTLVLMNGKRLPPGDPQSLAPDLNQIPPALIQRVEILTGGASAIYGSDAIAGVVNFILNDRFQGVQGDVAYESYGHKQKNPVADLVRARNYFLPGDTWNDAATTSTSLTLGGNFAQDKGNATVSFRYHKSEALLQSQRDYSACALNDAGGSLACGGSPTTNPVHVIDPGFSFNFPGVDGVRRHDWTLTSAGGVRPFLRFVDPNHYNFAPLNYYQRPAERYGFNAFANYNITPEMRVYGEFGYHDDRTVAQIGESGIFNEFVQIAYDNPLLSDAWRSVLTFRNPDGTIGTGPGTAADIIVARRNVEGGGRQDDRRHTSSRAIAGLKGVLAQHWDYDLFFQTSRVEFQETYKHDFSISRSIRALDVVPDPATGLAVCASALSGIDPNCVPYNVWALNGVSNAALRYLETPGFQRGLTTQQVAGGTVSANLGDYGIRIPTARGGVEVVLGIERRTEKLEFETDVEFATGDLAGQGQPVRGVAGGFTVKEFFGEARVPVFDALNLTGSSRRSDYSTGNITDTFGIGFTATPMKFARVRGSYQRAVRAPDLNELFTPQFPSGYELPDGDDPCAGATPRRPLADCRRTGVSAALYGRILENPFTGFPSTAGGNTALKPETARTYTLGLVLTPAPDFSATLDYFDIQLEDTISLINGAVIFQQCIDTGDPIFCQLIARDASTGTLWIGRGNIVAINQNIGKTRVSGVDVAVNYRHKLPHGHAVALDLVGSYLRRWTVEPFPGAPASDCAGYFFTDCSRPAPKWRHRVRATWQSPWNFKVAATWRYIHSVRNAISDSLSAGLEAVNYFDLAASWDISKRMTLRAGLSNIADRDPPLVAGGSGFYVNGNTFPQIYDALGRRMFASLTARF